MLWRSVNQARSSITVCSTERLERCPPPSILTMLGRTALTRSIYKLHAHMSAVTHGKKKKKKKFLENIDESMPLCLDISSYPDCDVLTPMSMRFSPRRSASSHIHTETLFPRNFGIGAFPHRLRLMSVSTTQP